MAATVPPTMPASAPRLSDLMSDWPGALRLDRHCTLAEAVNRLDAAPDAPGVMVETGRDHPVPLSRRALTSGLGVAIAAPGAAADRLSDFAEKWAAPLLVLSSSTLLGDAVRSAVARDASTRFEPVLIVDPDRPTFMVDLRVLLLAQCAALESAVGLLTQARAAAENAAADRTRFLAALGHEIRTPMTAMIGFAEYLAGDALSPQDRAQHGAAIRRNADHLLAIVNDFLDASRIESGKMTVERIACNPLQCVGEAIDMLRPAADARALTIRQSTGGDVPQAITADPLRLRQILINLLSNAIKFTDHGSIAVHASYDDSRSLPVLAISVSDTGAGMTPAQCREVFDGFRQADPSIPRRFGGSGLGLSISREFARLMGGDLVCDSTPGRGSTFTLSLPAPPSAGATAAPRRAIAQPAVHSRSPRPLLGLRILLAEDGADNRRLLHAHLTRAGAEMILVADGFAAVQAAMAPQYGALPIDLILMDVEMPVLDGLQAARVLRSRRYAGPIIALTAHDTPEHRVRCLEAGCNEFLTKPVERSTLIQTVAAWVHDSVRATGPSRPPRADAA